MSVRNNKNMEFKKYRKKPVVIEAAVIEKKTVIHTREGTLVGYPGDMWIRGIEGEEYPCDPEIFKKTYDPVDEGD